MSFQIEKKNNIYYGIFTEFFEKKVTAVTSLRQGGVSLAPYDSLNMGLHTSDKKADVIKNREIFFKIHNINFNDIVTLKQIHSDKAVLITSEDKAKGSLNYDDSFAEADAMVTKEKGVPLVIFTADCMSIFFCDPIKRIIGIAHSGWKGTYLNISQNVIKTMIDLGAEKRDIITALGPAISSSYYEVGVEFTEKFQDKFIEIKNKKYYFNLHEANKYNIISSGIPEENVIISDLCTYQNKDLCFSYRRDHETGRMASVIMLWE